MGCNTSKLDDEEAVQICKDRKKFIKQALEHRTKFAVGHVAYIQSMKRVSAALREYIEGDEPREFSLDSIITPPFTPVKKLNPKFITISPKCFSAPAIQCGENSKVRINYYRPSGTESISVEERPRSPDTYRVQSYSPVHQYGGFDGWFTTRSPVSPQRDPSYYSQSYSMYDRPDIPPPSPQNPSQWDFFWNPFSSLDYYGYPVRSSLEQSMVDDDVAGLRKVREEEGIPDLEEETEHEEIDEKRRPRRVEKPKVDSHVVREEVTVEDVDENDDDDDHDDLDDDDDEEEEETEEENEDKHKVNGLMEDVNDRIAPLAPLKGPNGGQVEVNRHETMFSKREKKEEEAPGFTVYVNRRPTSMDEVIKDLETQFTIVCRAASEVSAMLEANRALHLPATSEVTGM